MKPACNTRSLPRRRAVSSRLACASLFVIVAVLGPACTSVDGQCQTVCTWEQRCVQGSVSVDDCSQQCVNDAKSRSNDCSDAFDQFASCTGENESCPGVDKQCSDEAATLIAKCDCESPRGPLAELCKK